MQPPALKHVLQMPSDNVKAWRDIASDQMELFWDQKACEYQPGFECWAELEDFCIAVLVQRSN